MKEISAKEINESIRGLQSGNIAVNLQSIFIKTAENAFITVAPHSSEQEVTASDLQKLNSKQLQRTNNTVFRIFSHHADISAVIACSPKFCAVAASCYKRIPPVLDDMAQIVGVYAEVVELEDQNRILRLFKKNHALIIKNNADGIGAIAAGRDLAQAAAAALILEKSAQVFIEAQYLGGAKALHWFNAKRMNHGYRTKYSKMNTNVRHLSERDYSRKIAADELELRAKIVEMGKRLVRENLMQGTWGNISVRLNNHQMLVTPSGIDYFSLSPYDIVLVDLESLEHEGSLKPTSEKLIHADSLKKNKDINCIIHTHPLHCGAYIAAHKPLIVTAPEIKSILKGNVAIADYAASGTKKLAENILRAIKENSACFMANHGLVVCGSSLEDALKKCRTIEAYARSELDKLLHTGNA